MAKSAKPHCETCKCRDAATEARWNDAVDWLLNSRHLDDEILQAFWGIVDGKHTRERAEELT